MNTTAPLSSFNPFLSDLNLTKILSPCIMVIFGATGDLTLKKLFPSLYELEKTGLLPQNFFCIAYARKDKTQQEFLNEIKQSIVSCFKDDFYEEAWLSIEKKILYFKGNLDVDNDYISLKKDLEKKDDIFKTKGNRIFYLSTPPKYFPLIIGKLSQNSLIYNPSEENSKWSRVIIEKPFGKDLFSAQKLQECVASSLKESQVYRIDHYLGKETVQNILTLRFANSIFEAFWNNHYIDHVQITVSESIGISSRGRFFEELGMLRDVVQNHVMQILTLLAMEPPAQLTADAIRDEKVKVLNSLNPLNLEDVVRGQYTAGFIQGEPVKGYREELDVSPSSQTETYIALKLFINNWRWEGVPFYLRAGKRLPKKCTDIGVIFKTPPQSLFGKKDNLEKDLLSIRIQPNEGIALKFNCKIPGTSNLIKPVKMDFKYSSYFGNPNPEAYQRLICDCISGDGTLFARNDEVLTSWKWFSPLLNLWGSKNSLPIIPNYLAGSWGPKEADELIKKDHREWRLL